MTSLAVMSRAAATATNRVIAQRSGLVVSGIFYLMVTAILAALWSTAARANGGEIVGYSATALVWYVATTEAAVVSIPLRLIEDVGDDLGSGRVEVELLRPASLLAVRLASEFGTMLPRLAVCMGAGTVFASVMGGAPPDPVGLALAAPALVLAVGLNLVTQHAFAGGAFWVRDAKGMWFLYQKLIFVLGGMLIPLEVLPGWLESIAKALPFMAMAYAPARLASGHVEPVLLLVQVGWIVVLGTLAFRIYAAGERRLSEVGA